VAKRVCITDDSSAKSSAISRSAATPTGSPGTPTTATRSVPAGARAKASTTSVVVAEREIASTRSYGRPSGASEAGKASVSPPRSPASATATW